MGNIAGENDNPTIIQDMKDWLVGNIPMHSAFNSASPPLNAGVELCYRLELGSPFHAQLGVWGGFGFRV